MSVADYTHALRKLLPQGRAWEFITAPGTFAWDALLTALAGEAQRIEDDGYLLLNKVIPDNANTDLDMWEEIVGVSDEELTDAERLARIRTILYGPPDVNLASLQTLARLLANDNAVALFNRVYEPFAAGLANAGDSLASGEWDFTWLLESMHNVTGADPDNFSVWTGLTAVTPDVAQSPVTLDTTATAATIPSAAWASEDLSGPSATDSGFESGDVLRVSLWVYPITVAATIRLGLRAQDGSTITDTSWTLTPDRWHKITHEGTTTTGSSAPQMLLRATGGDRNVYLSWHVAVVKDLDFEARVASFFPLHTRGVFAVINEYATLLSHDPLEVIF